MAITDVLSRKSGVIVGDDVLRLFEYAREHKFAIPAIVSKHAGAQPEHRIPSLPVLLW